MLQALSLVFVNHFFQLDRLIATTCLSTLINRNFKLFNLSINKANISAYKNNGKKGSWIKKIQISNIVWVRYHAKQNAVSNGNSNQIIGVLFIL